MKGYIRKRGRDTWQLIYKLPVIRRQTLLPDLGPGPQRRGVSHKQWLLFRFLVPLFDALLSLYLQYFYGTFTVLLRCFYGAFTASFPYLCSFECNYVIDFAKAEHYLWDPYNIRHITATTCQMTL